MSQSLIGCQQFHALCTYQISRFPHRCRRYVDNVNTSRYLIDIPDTDLLRNIEKVETRASPFTNNDIILSCRYYTQFRRKMAHHMWSSIIDFFKSQDFRFRHRKVPPHRRRLKIFPTQVTLATRHYQFYQIIFLKCCNLMILLHKFTNILFHMTTTKSLGFWVLLWSITSLTSIVVETVVWKK